VTLSFIRNTAVVFARNLVPLYQTTLRSVPENNILSLSYSVVLC